jgi:Tfp pilus assembly protein PilX
MKKLSNQQGFLTIITVILIVIIGFISVAITYMFTNTAFSTNNFQEANKALYLADSGIEQATRALLLPDVANRSACSGLSITNSSIGSGTYTVTSTGPFYSPTPATTLSSAISSSAVTIPVVSTTGYQSSGRIMIDSELINYTAIDATNFLNATRGVDSTTATTHATGAGVGQYQCKLTSNGGVPTLSPTNPGDPGGIRQVNEYIQLQEAWTAGATSNTFRFNEAAWSNFTNGLSSTTLRSLSMLSYADGWTVGDKTSGNPFAAHWDGSSWIRASLTGIANVNLTGISCTSSNNCYAVGDRNGGSPFILSWNGSAWSQVTSITNAANTNLSSVYCDSANDCWAVGASIGSRFYQWNGTAWSGVTNTLSSYPYNSVFCNTSTDCWAVGANGTFARKNGATWADFATGLPAVTYNSVFCNSTSDCWAVGNISSGDLYAHWDGASWSRSGPYAGIPDANLNSVACANTNDCWAVGDNSSGALLTHWDGSNWSRIGPAAGLASVNLYSVSIISPHSQPWNNWTENFS